MARAALIGFFLAVTVSTAYSRSSRVLRSSPNVITMQLENGTIIQDDISKPVLRPLSFDENKVTFYCYTNQAQGVQVFKDDIKSFERCGFDSKYPTKILVHGYTSTYQAESVQKVKTAYLQYHSKCNIIIADYEYYNFPYLSLCGNVGSIGNAIGAFLRSLQDKLGVNLKRDCHCLGHSMGAHICGAVGASIPDRIARITGMDPAGPVMGANGINNRLDPTDAKFVDVIHTSDLLGMKKPCGHIDFWPHGGDLQPRCAKNFMQELVDACSHSESCTYMAESIAQWNMYPGARCNSHEDARSSSCPNPQTAFMGEHAIDCVPGQYYVDVSFLEK